MISLGWLLYAMLLVFHLILCVPGLLFMAEYWDDDQLPAKPGVQRTMFLFIQFLIGAYCLLWVFGIVGALVSLGGGSAIACLVDGVVVVTLFLFMLMLAFAARTERSYRRE